MSLVAKFFRSSDAHYNAQLHMLLALAMSVCHLLREPINKTLLNILQSISLPVQDHIKLFARGDWSKG